MATPASKDMTFYTPRLLLTLVSLVTAIAPYIADFNTTHVYNPLWPGHARFHNGQTMSMGAYLGLLTLYKTWVSSSNAVDDHLATPCVVGAAYYVTQASAYYYPGATAWDPPQSFGVGPVHLFVVVPMLSLVGVAFGMERWRVGRQGRGRGKGKAA
ncbi:hypothetical protein BAUCODRAFT_107842 [Baudoinia panamericana UAMH 10762]|uniref:EXPERA domain-containing protein n=1 Tax=Baudoinia panamericana (strain UAMH 10762) TaxID=717646 RepID=M2MXM3_BAUPA|nr:uncharacterized protein BAUCODRAFT_107842 [Baudoinia panamericana UAMH 10762]EMC96318.1 hypothetical protein BAUCODRAFT_107842 [Baudoinia panamericana UAMH 10762]